MGDQLACEVRELCDKWRRCYLWPGVRYGHDVGRIVVLNSESGTLYTLDGAGGIAWEQLCAEDNRLLAYLKGLSPDQRLTTINRLNLLLDELKSKRIVTTDPNPVQPFSPKLLVGMQRAISFGLRLSIGLTCACALAITRMLLLTRGFGETVRLVTSLPVAKSRAGHDSNSFVRAVSLSAALFPGRAECLEQSLTLVALLKAAGRSTELQFGARAYPLLAHAWAECEGSAVNEHPDVVQTLIRLRGVNDVVFA